MYGGSTYGRPIGSSMYGGSSYGSGGYGSSYGAGYGSGAMTPYGSRYGGMGGGYGSGMGMGMGGMSPMGPPGELPVPAVYHLYSPPGHESNVVSVICSMILLHGVLVHDPSRASYNVCIMGAEVSPVLVLWPVFTTLAGGTSIKVRSCSMIRSTEQQCSQYWEL